MIALITMLAPIAQNLIHIIISKYNKICELGDI